jgi:hypothetical protein
MNVTKDTGSSLLLSLMNPVTHSSLHCDSPNIYVQRRSGPPRLAFAMLPFRSERVSPGERRSQSHMSARTDRAYQLGRGDTAEARIIYRSYVLLVVFATELARHLSIMC